MQRIGDYELLDEIARGGMGVVYRARGPQGLVALKLVLDPDPELRLRFRQELDALRRLEHPAIVGYQDLVQDGQGRDALVMELVEGESLAQRLRLEGPLPVTEAVDLTRQLCLAVQHAHDRRVLHRDLKPANVLVTRDRRVKLTDFGLGKVTDLSRDPARSRSSLTQDGELLGTPAYMPPEQAQGDKAALGPAADVYGLGATLFALLSGQAPFGGATVINVLNAVLERPAPRVRSLRPEVSAAVDEVVARCLAKDPHARPASAAALEQALGAALGAERPPRGRPVVAGTIALVLVTVGTAGGLAIATRRPSDLAAAPRASRSPASTPTAPAPSPERSSPASLAEGAPSDSPAESPSPGQTVPADLQRRIDQTLAQLARGDARLAEIGFAALLAQFPNHPQALAGRAEAMSEQGRWKEAQVDVDRGLSLAPNLSPVDACWLLGLRGRVLWHQEQIDEARAAFSEALTGGLFEDPRVSRSPSIRLWYGEMESRLGFDEPAIAQLTQALATARDDRARTQALMRRADTHSSAGRHDAALADLDAALEVASPREQLEVLLARSMEHCLRGDSYRALADVHTVLQRQPDSVAAVLQRATVHTWNGRTAEALADLDRLVAGGITNGAVLAQRGRLRWLAGQEAAALTDFEHAFTLAPSFHNQLWLALCRGESASLSDLPLLDGYDRSLAAVVVGENSLEELLRSIGDSPYPRLRRERRSEALAIYGLRLEVLDGDAEGARLCYEQCLACGQVRSPLYAWARERLRSGRPLR